MSECGDSVVEEHGEVTHNQAEEILQRIRNLAELRARATASPLPDAVRAVTAEFVMRDKLEKAQAEREHAGDAEARQRLVEFAGRAPTLGEGIMAKLEGSAKSFPGARNSVDAQLKLLIQKWYGQLTDNLTKAGAFREFRTNALEKEVYREMGQPGASGSPKAAKIAEILTEAYKEQNARFNQAGGFRGDMPGYVAMQTHDRSLIRAAGSDKATSRSAWVNFTLPKLDQEKTFLGADPQKFMRNVHDNLYSGVHGVLGDSGVTSGNFGLNFAAKGSQERVLHFKTPEDAYEYSQKFGVKDLKEQALSTFTANARAVALMENLGPNAERNLALAVRGLREIARERDDAAVQVDSLSDYKINSAFHQLTGQNSIPDNPTLARISGNLATVAQLSKMGGVALTKIFGDKAFLQSDALFQGISQLDTLAKQITTLLPRSAERLSTLRLMGVGLDGLMGNALSRYSSVGPVSSRVDQAQKLFFNINFLNYITDSHKQGLGELMASHLGQHSETQFTQLPDTLRKVLGLYDIGDKDWDAMRASAYDHPGGWGKVITPDKLNDSALETKARAYFSDRIDFGVPTPGAAERRLVQMDTRSGTPLGEAVRLMGLFKSFPMTIMNKVLRRDVYGNGSNTVGQWLLNDHQGKFNMATMIAMCTAGGYMSMAIKEALAGKPVGSALNEGGGIDWARLNDAAVRGGGLGLAGDLVMHDYDRHYSSFLETMAGPVLGQSDAVMRLATQAKRGEDVGPEAYKLGIDNLPMLNLFYVRPALNYYVLWNLQEMMSPGSAARRESRNRQ